ncbi:MAG: hypothetical protein KGQ45_17440, partial [Burkholderiales bacterium]|nr:hypothetical protein [Burkholderiales bacterium]
EVWRDAADSAHLSGETGLGGLARASPLSTTQERGRSAVQQEVRQSDICRWRHQPGWGPYLEHCVPVDRNEHRNEAETAADGDDGSARQGP